MVERVADPKGLRETASKSEAAVVIGFFGGFSEESRKALPEFERACSTHPERAAFVVDVGQIKDLHPAYGVDSVPTVVVVKDGRVLQRIVGTQTAAFYERALFGGASSVDSKSAEAKPNARPAHRVVVYTSDTCVWCSRVKAHLRSHDVPFQEINVSRDHRAAQRMVARSGQQGVPQLDIDGKLVVGFDRARIDSLLGLSERARDSLRRGAPLHLSQTIGLRPAHSSHGGTHAYSTSQRSGPVAPRRGRGEDRGRHLLA